MTEVTGAEFSPAAPAARHYVSGRFAIQDHAPVARQPSPAPQQEPAKAPDSMTWSPVVVYTQPAPQYVALRPVYVQPGEQAGDVYGNVSKGLDKIRAANVQHQKTLRDLIIFHRPGEAVLSNEAAFDKLVWPTTYMVLLSLRSRGFVDLLMEQRILDHFVFTCAIVTSGSNIFSSCDRR